MTTLATITLDEKELVAAATVGVLRCITHLVRGDTMKHRGTRDWTLDIEGACAECAAAKGLGVYWDGMGLTGDVRGVEVRHTQRPDGHLLLHDGDDQGEKPYLLVTGSAPTYVLRGWVWGHEGKRPVYCAGPPRLRTPGYMVPQAALRPFATLLALVPIGATREPPPIALVALAAAGVVAAQRPAPRYIELADDDVIL